MPAKPTARSKLARRPGRCYWCRRIPLSVVRCPLSGIWLTTYTDGMRRILPLLLTLLSVAAFAAAPKVTTIIIVRHAEKAGPEGDVPLSDAGHARAEELARVPGSAGVTAIYDT